MSLLEEQSITEKNQWQVCEFLLEVIWAFAILHAYKIFTPILVFF